MNHEKRITDRTVRILRQYKKFGVMMGICTSGSEQNSFVFIRELCPDITISSGGALIQTADGYLFKNEFTIDETRSIISRIKEIVGSDCEITVDTMQSHYWNDRDKSVLAEENWGKSVYRFF